MKSLLHLEYRRLFRAKSFYICLAVSFALIFISLLTTKLLYKAMQAISTEEGGLFVTGIEKPSILPLLKNFGGSSFTIITAIFIALFVSEDYTGDTVKNIYAKGNTKDLVFCSKYISSLSSCLIFMAANILFILIVGILLGFETGTVGTNYTGSMFTAALILVAYHAIYFAITISIRKTGGSIAISILGPTIISLLLTLLDTLLKIENFSISSYWISNLLSAMSFEEVETSDITAGIIVSVCLIAASIAASFFVNRKREN